MEISGNYYIKTTHAISLLVGTNVYQYEENQRNFKSITNMCIN